MNKILPNTSLFFDYSKKNDMQLFLDRMYNIAIQNPSFKITDKVIYNEIRYGLLPASEKDEKDFSHGADNRRFFERWRKDFKGKKNIHAVYSDEYLPQWFQFYNKLDFVKDFIKIYVPINGPHLYKGVKELFSFLDEENIEHASIISSKMRTDNVVIRIEKDDTESLKKIIDFITSNKYLSTGLNYTSPFIPTVKGIGIMNDRGNSYNSIISIFVSNYVNQCLQNGIRPKIDEFRNYLLTYTSDKDVADTFENAYKGRTKFYPRGEKKNDSNFTLEQKTYLLIDALKATFIKYGILQAERALYNAGSFEDFGYFTDGGNLKLRGKLKNNVTKEDIMQIVKYALPNFLKPKEIAKDNDGKIEQFVKVLFEDQLLLSLDEACLATLEKYGAESLERAINKFISIGDPIGFTRQGNYPGRVNYREQVIKIGKDRFVEYMKKSIQLRGYDAEDIGNNLVSAYIEVLKNSRYTNTNDSPIISR